MVIIVKDRNIIIFLESLLNRLIQFSDADLAISLQSLDDLVTNSFRVAMRRKFSHRQTTNELPPSITDPGLKSIIWYCPWFIFRDGVKSSKFMKVTPLGRCSWSIWWWKHHWHRLYHDFWLGADLVLLSEFLWKSKSLDSQRIDHKNIFWYFLF